MHNYIVIKSWHLFYGGYYYQSAIILMIIGQAYLIIIFQKEVLNKIIEGHKIIVISFNKKDSELNWLLNILIRSYPLSSVSSVPLTSDLSYAFFLFLLSAIGRSNHHQPTGGAKKILHSCVCVWQRERDRMGREGEEREKKNAKNECPRLAQHERKSVQSGQSINVHVIPGYYALTQSHLVYLILKHKNRVS